MKVVFAQEMRELDQRTIKELGIPGAVLMENAGYACFQVALELLGGGCENARAGVLCGKGNNGGDGLVLARHLVNNGADVKVFLLASKEELTGDAALNLKAAVATRVPIMEVNDKNWNEMENFLAQSDLVVDAILGTGAKGVLKPPFDRAVETINQTQAPRLAVDIPTGVDSDTGAVAGSAVLATATVTFALPKMGLFTYPGADYCGGIFVADISIPQWLIEESQTSGELITPDMALEWLPSRPADAHKGDCGRVLLIGGSRGMIGAPVLMARAASLSGAGLVYIAVPEGITDPVAARLDGEIIRPLPRTQSGSVSRSAKENLDDLIKTCDAAAIGPGLTLDPETKQFVLDFISSCPIPLVIDADGLNALADNLNILSERKAATIITPHPGEAGGLLGQKTIRVQENRFQAVNELSKLAGSMLPRGAKEQEQTPAPCSRVEPKNSLAVAVLKGAATLIADNEENTPVYINPTGNPGMAAGGAGDVLTGLITGFLAQGLLPVEAAALGAYVHGLAGDLAAESIGGMSLGPGDILNFLPQALNAILKNQAPAPVDMI